MPDVQVDIWATFFHSLGQVLEPGTHFRPPALYLTVEDLEGFAAALTERGIPGEDRRQAR